MDLLAALLDEKVERLHHILYYSLSMTMDVFADDKTDETDT